MNEQGDPLEAELRALSPHVPSPQLRQGIGERIAAETVIPSRRFRRLALAASLLAACIASAVYLRRDDPQPVAVTPSSPPDVAVASTFDDSMPSAWVYRRAMRGSADELNALLAKHASAFAGTDARLVTVNILMRSDTKFDPVLGEL
ncbi:MAG: hypothetical protein WD851_18405 [Pirellulales bacterium]